MNRCGSLAAVLVLGASWVNAQDKAGSSTSVGLPQIRAFELTDLRNLSSNKRELSQIEAAEDHDEVVKDYNQVEFKYKGQKWWAAWLGSSDGASFIRLFGPDGSAVSVRDAPFHLRENGREVEIWTRGPASLRSANAAERSGVYSPLGSVSYDHFGRSANADERRWVYLLTDEIIQENVLVFDQSTGVRDGSIPIPSRPLAMTLNREATRLYVSHLGVAAGEPVLAPAPPRISILDTSARRVLETIALPADAAPNGLQLSPDGRYLYIANRGVFTPGPGHTGSSVIVWDTQTKAVAATIVLPAGSTINRLALTPDGALLYAVSPQTFPARVFVFDTYTRTHIATFLAPASLNDILLDHTGTRLYLLTADTVVVYDTATNTELTRTLIRNNGRLNSLTLSLNGRTLSVNDQQGPSIFHLDTSSMAITGETRITDQNAEFSLVFAVP